MNFSSAARGQAPLTDAEHEVKLRDCLNRGLEGDAVEEVLALLGELESLDVAGVRHVCELLS